jgi:hypothetical protein
LTAPASPSWLNRTRSGVLNVLVASGIGIATSSLLLRWRDGWAVSSATVGQRRMLLGGLFILTVMSYASRRILVVRSRLGEAAGRANRLYWAHITAAVIASLAVPLGLAYGWFVRPRLDAVAPFWIAALALGFLAMPRSIDFEDLPDESES